MRRLGTIILLAAALLLSSLTLTSANARDADENQNGDTMSLLLTAVSNQFEDIDVGAKGPSLGDGFAFNDKLYMHKTRVGTLDGTCTVTRLQGSNGAQQCVVTLTLPHGQLTAQGVIEFQGESVAPFTVAVTGGTGKFSDADGEAHVTFLSETRTRIRVDLDD